MRKQKFKKWFVVAMVFTLVTVLMVTGFAEEISQTYQKIAQSIEVYTTPAPEPVEDDIILEESTGDNKVDEQGEIEPETIDDSSGQAVSDDDEILQQPEEDKVTPNDTSDIIDIQVENESNYEEELIVNDDAMSMAGSMLGISPMAVSSIEINSPQENSAVTVKPGDTVQVTYTITAGNEGHPTAVEVSINIDGLINTERFNKRPSDKQTVLFKIPDGTAAGKYNVTINAAQSNTLPKDPPFTYTHTKIEKNAIIVKPDITVRADSVSKIYGDADDLTYTVIGKLNEGDELEGALSRAPGEEVGEYKINSGTLGLNNNIKDKYNLTIDLNNAKLNITSRPVKVTANAQSKVYGENDPALTYKIINGSLAFEDDFTGSLTRVPGEGVGAYVIQQGTLALNDNYVLSFVEGTLTIGKRSIEITADDKSKTYGDADPALTYQISDGSLAFEDEFTGSLTRVPGEGVGAHVIQQGTLALNDNYVLSFVEGTLTIGKRSIEITADDKSKTYGDADPALTYQISDGSLAFEDDFTGSLTRVPGEGVGAHVIQQGTLALNDNYVLSFVEATLTIGKRSIQVTADNRSKIYGEADPALTYKITRGSLVYNDAFTGALNREVGEDVDEYSITQGNLALKDNYVLNFVEGTLTIDKRSIEVTADNQSKIYGGADPALTYKITRGFLAFKDEFSGSLLREEGENVGKYNINEGTLKLNDNYIIKFVSNVFNIYYGMPGLQSPYTSPSEGKGFKIGSSIPLKWQFTNHLGMVVSSAGAKPEIIIRIVKSEDTRGDTIELNDSGNSGLRYQNGTWQYNWQTKGLEPGIYEITIKSNESGQENKYLILLRI